MKKLFIKNETQQNWLDRLFELKEKFTSKSAEIDELSIFPKENIQDLVSLGYSSVTLPKEYNGEGLTVYDMVLLQETIASYDANTALSIGWSLGVVGDLFENKLWTQDKLNFFAKEILNGALVNRSVSETQTGSPTRGGRPGTAAVKDGNNWVLNGRKIFTTASPVLTYFLTSAWIEEEQKVGFFLIHRDTEGVSIEDTWDVISMRGTSSNDLILKDVVVHESDLVELPEFSSGGKPNGWLLHIPATYLGVAQAARDYAVHFANTHAPNSLNGPIAKLPNVQQLIGEIDLELTKARFIIYGVASAYDNESSRNLLSNEIGAAKHIVTNSAITIVDKAMRLVGAKSLQRTNPLQRYYRDVRAGLHNPPMDDMTIKKLALTALEEDLQ
ncbi:alkylation response protein AidB-like acyl-CoA dehydrogenase [Psychrobacillus insolitus]|uniref:Alkylation response protein AidB-like acyl-CoA dehydrogenase n=1 Tax=Psychrobacillus insolitus TaxID=1461 RepID=A0A2W7N4S3_9BACI|nr:acyl-CoA dehydrogenase family protein [Psychrobacillus insolitus]PZX03971.1 alkylation response protein AidB-like acyl-CoA dehydrogenase [Psychrobacillus insolitus]